MLEAVSKIVVLVGQIAAGKSTLGRWLQREFCMSHVRIDDLRICVRLDEPASIASEILKSAAVEGLVFECSGTSEGFESLLEALELRADRVIVVKLLCETNSAIQRVRGRGDWTPPTSGTAWAEEIARTELRLRRVPADFTIDTTNLCTEDVAGRVADFLRAEDQEAGANPELHCNSVSFSKLALHERCPLAFHFKYVAKVPEAFVSEKTLLGQLIHASLARLYAPKTDHDQCSLQALLQAFQASIPRFSGEPVSHGLVRRLREQGEHLLTRHYERVYRYDRLSTLQVEHEFAFALEPGKRVTGRIDRLARSESGVPVVIDFKTGSDRSSYLSDVPDLLQLEVYGVAVLHELEREAVEVRRHAVRSGKEECHGVTTRDVPRIQASILRWMRIVRRNRYPVAKPGKICEWCSYNPTCKLRARAAGDGIVLSSNA